MDKKTDLNKIVPLRYRKKLNLQKNITILKGRITESGKIIQPFRCVVGLGEKHFYEFNQRFQKIIDVYPWLKRRHARFIINELILNSQFAALREAVHKILEKRKVAAYITVTIYVNQKFLSASIEEYGDYFDYYSLYESNLNEKNKQFFDQKEKMKSSGNELWDTESLKIILTEDDRLMVPDESNMLALRMIEQATDYDFYVTSFFRDGKYMWKRIYFRVEAESF